MSLAILKHDMATSVDRAMGHDQRIVGGQRLELVGRGANGRPVISAIFSRDLLGKACRRGEAGADGGAALGQFHQRGSVISMRLMPFSICLA
jgi:hypothetical protein